MEKYIKLLSQVELFENIEKDDLLSLSQCLNFKIKEYKKGEIIILPGQRINHLALVLEGQVQIIKEDYYGSKNIIGNIKKTGIFAEAISLAQEESPVSVVSLEKTKVLFLNTQRILTSCDKCCQFHNILIFNLMNILARKNIILNEKIDHLSKKTIEEKLMAYLFSVAEKKKTSTFTIPYNRQELADYLSVNRSALSKELSRLKGLNIIDYKKNKFTIL